MKNVKMNRNKTNSSIYKSINNSKSKSGINNFNKKEQNKSIKRDFVPNNKNNQNKIKEKKFQTERGSKNIILNKNQNNFSKENNEPLNLKEEEKIQNNNLSKNNEQELIEKKDSIILNVNNVDNKDERDKEEEKKENEKNLYLKLSQEEINRLVINDKRKLKKSVSNNNILKDKLNILKNLKDKQKSLLKEIDKINGEKKYYNEFSLNNLSLDNKLYKNIQRHNIKYLEKNENYVIQKINLVNQEINNININNQVNEKKINEEERKNKEEINKKLKQFKKENNIIFKRIKEDANLNMDKRIKELDILEKEENNRKKWELIKKNKEEKNIEKKRGRKIIKEVIKNKQFINSNNKRGQKRNYLYFKMASSFEKNEEILFKNQKIKLKIKSYNEEKERKINNYLEQKRLEMIDNINNLHNIWKERNNLLPKYKSPLYEKILYSEENNKENERNKLENKKRLYCEKEKYCKEKIPLPPISNLLKKQSDRKNGHFYKINASKRKINNTSIDNSGKINKYNKNSTRINNQKYGKLYSIFEQNYIVSKTSNEN